MYNFSTEDLIKSMRDGLTAEQLAEMFSNALNAAEDTIKKENEAAEKLKEFEAKREAEVNTFICLLEDFLATYYPAIGKVLGEILDNSNVKDVTNFLNELNTDAASFGTLFINLPKEKKKKKKVEDHCEAVKKNAPFYITTEHLTPEEAEKIIKKFTDNFDEKYRKVKKFEF